MPEPPKTSDHLEEPGVCPFCRREFPGHTECPEHELSLVPVRERGVGGTQDPRRVEVLVDPRFGRWGVLLGSLLVLIAFAAPFARSSGIEASALVMAIDGAKNLWLVPCAALGQLWVLWSRRSPLLLRPARAAVFGLAVGGTLPLGYTTWRIAKVARATGQPIDWSWGLWLMLMGFVLSAVTAWRLGGAKVPTTVRRRAKASG